MGLTTLDVLHRVEHLPGPDEKVTALRADVAAGGPAANAAVTSAALGSPTVLVSALGPGPVARLAREDLDAHGVEVLDGHRGGGDVPVSAITVHHATGRRSVVSRNAEDVRAEPPRELTAVVSGAAAVLVDGHHPDLVRATVAAAAAAGVPVLLDAGSWKPVLGEVLPGVDVAVCSSVFRAPDADSAEETAAVLLGAGVRVVAVTAGAAPIRWWTATTQGQEAVPSVPVRDTLGAGDAFHGAVLHAMACGADVPASLAFAVRVASVRVAHVGPRAWLADTRLPAGGQVL